MQTTQRSIWTGAAIAVAAAVLGLLGLPIIFGSFPDPTQAVLWLALAVLTCVCLLIPTRPLASALAAALSRVPQRRGLQATWTGHAARDLASLLIAAGYLLLAQGILRHPVVAVFGTSAEPFIIEAAIAVFALVVLLVLLGSIYRAAGPLVESLAWSALDSLFATSGSEEAARAARTLTPVVTSTIVAAPGSGATITRIDAPVDETLPRSARAQR